MKRNHSSDLGRSQADGNLGNERNRGPAGISESGQGGEQMRNRSSDSPLSGGGRNGRETSRADDRSSSADVDIEDDAGMPSGRIDR